ncbi:LAQU0S01e07954g1_1 [Lachancea quebecensis]|uniref:LAQU0S01e07954g1_1 n=1 Tax=Lachancea quebecensis TaxID=1654605 RepID=A0A0P1KMA7_9SACH|nr:LAQU0S01e07954g1_1 [Lachancea quebecensis]
MPDVCYKRLVTRDFVSGAKDTAKSFKNWDSCMDNRACKIIAIVGIVIASIVALWIVGSLLRCFKYGASGVLEFCCWCCGAGRHHGVQRPITQPHAQPGASGGPPMVIYQPVAAPQDAYYRGDSFYEERSSVKELEQDFDLEAQRPENKRRASGAHATPANYETAPLVYDEDPREDHELSVYHPRLTTAMPAQGYTPQAPYPRDEQQDYGKMYRHGNY